MLNSIRGRSAILAVALMAAMSVAVASPPEPSPQSSTYITSTSKAQPVATAATRNQVADIAAAPAASTVVATAPSGKIVGNLAAPGDALGVRAVKPALCGHERMCSGADAQHQAKTVSMPGTHADREAEGRTYRMTI